MQKVTIQVGKAHATMLPMLINIDKLTELENVPGMQQAQSTVIVVVFAMSYVLQL